MTEEEITARLSKSNTNIEVGTWQARVVLCYSDRREDGIHTVARIFNEDLSDIKLEGEESNELTTTGACFYHDGSATCVIWLNKEIFHKNLCCNNTIIECLIVAGWIIHECIHASHHILRERGYTMEALHINDEPLAYLAQYLYENILEILLENPNK